MTPRYHQTGDSMGREAAHAGSHNSRAMRHHHFGPIVPMAMEPRRGWLARLLRRGKA